MISKLIKNPAIMGIFTIAEVTSFISCSGVTSNSQKEEKGRKIVAETENIEKTSEAMDELLIQFIAGIPEERAMEISRELGFHDVRKLQSVSLYAVKVPARQDLEQLLEEVKSHPDVLGVAPNLKFKIQDENSFLE